MKPIYARSCTDAWTQACAHLQHAPDRRDNNLVLEITEPMTLAPAERLVVDEVSRFLELHHAMPFSSIVNTIFPAQLYQLHGADGVYSRYMTEIFPKIKKYGDCAWGTYAQRMLERTDGKGKRFNPLQDLVGKMRKNLVLASSMRSSYEMSVSDLFADIPIYDPGVDRKRPFGGPCLSHLSFKISQDKQQVLLTAIYRSHFYIERTLGNLLGLAHLLNFVARETGMSVGTLTCVSTAAVLDDGKWSKTEVDRLLATSCTHMAEPAVSVEAA